MIVVALINTKHSKVNGGRGNQDGRGGGRTEGGGDGDSNNKDNSKDA